MIHNIADLRLGDKVYYQPEHYSEDDWENGRIKEIRSNNHEAVWVVYNCAGKWDNYIDYTGALTNLRDLTIGWKD